MSFVACATTPTTPSAAPAVRATVSVDIAEAEISMDETIQVTATVKNGQAGDIVSWKSWDDAIATVKDGLITPVAPGFTTIEAAIPNGEAAYVNVTVSEVVGLNAKVYILEGASWTSARSEPVFIKAGKEGRYEFTVSASELVLRNVAAMYLKDMEIEENKAPDSILKSCVISVESISVNGFALPLFNNVDIEAVNDKGQLDRPFINEWNTAIEIVEGLPTSGHRDLAALFEGSKVQPEGNVVKIVLTAKAALNVEKAAAAAEAAAKPVLDDAATYHAFFGIQASDSWVFRNSYASDGYGFGTPEFTNGLFDTDNGGKAIQGVVTDAALTKADIEAGKTFTVSLANFVLDDPVNKATGLNLAFVSTDIPFGAVAVKSAKLIFDGKQVNLSPEGEELFTLMADKKYTLISFINIWDKSVKTFQYSLPKESVVIEFTLSLE
jgi:hypothetical protein